MSTSASLGEFLRSEIGGLLDAEVAALERHYDLLIRWNRKMNLTTVTSVEEAATRHYGESILLARQLTAGSVVDIGSGGGFPGIPAAIVRPDCVVTLVESHQRKAVFLREAVREVGNVQVIADRAESMSGHYDWLVSRAVDPSELMKLRIADLWALLVGAEDAECLGATSVTALPWGRNRVIAIGSFGE